MTHKRIYISGPMSGKPDFNYPTFNAVARRWRAEGHRVHNPAENFNGSQTEDYAAYMREDLTLLLNSNAIAMLPGWESSRGARFELMTAQMLGLEVLDAATLDELQPPSRIQTVLTY